MYLSSLSFLLLAAGATFAKGGGNNLLDRSGYGLARYGNRDHLVKRWGDEAMSSRGTFAVAGAIVSEVAVMAYSVPAAAPSFPSTRTRP